MRPDDILTLYSFNSLRSMARARQLPLGALRRPELIAALAEQLFDPPALRRIIGQLAAGERAIVEAVAANGGRIVSAELAQALRERGMIDGSGPARPRETIDRIPPTTRRFDELCARLTAGGLLFSEMDTAGSLAGPHDLNPGEVVFVPGPVLELLRETQASAAALQPEPAPPAPATGRLIVQPSYTVLALPPLDDPTLRRLHEFAEPVRVAEIGEFKLTQSALFNAVERGAALHEIVAFLEERSGGALPQNVRYSLEQWSRAFEQVQVIVNAALMDGPPELIDHLINDPAVAPLVVRRLQPERVLLRDAAAVEQALQALGELPAITRYDERGAARIEMSADGTITQTAPDLLLPIVLRRIAEPRSDGAFVIVPERVRHAVIASPDGLTGLIKWLRSYAGEVPPAVQARLRVWSLPPESVAIEQAVLLRLPADLLDDLRAIPELAPLLADEYRPEAALVRIAPADHDQLVAALRERGLLPPA